MAISYEGNDYVVNTPTDNAYEILDYVNEKMTELGVTNKDGDIVQFKVSLTSPIWLLIFGIGYMATVLQKIMYAVGKSFSVADCSDQQVLNLAQIAGITRKDGSYSTVNLRVTASKDGDCTVTTDNYVTITYNDEDYYFYPAADVTISAGNTDTVYCIASVTGIVYGAAGVVDAFDEDITNLSSVTNLAVVPGTDVETINNLRSRILSNDRVSPLTSVITAIGNLTGVVKAGLYYNTNNSTSQTIAGHTVAPRESILFIQGTSSKIAETYYKYLFSPTTNDDSEALTSSYTADNGQVFTVNYYTAEDKNLYIKVKLNTTITAAVETTIRDAIAALSNSLSMGSEYSQAYILQCLADSIPTEYQYISGVTLGTDGETYGQYVQLAQNEIGIINNDDESIVIGV